MMERLAGKPNGGGRQNPREKAPGPPRSLFLDTKMARLAGFEPTTSASAGQRSIH